jgi:hypothetical protein
MDPDTYLDVKFFFFFFFDCEQITYIICNLNLYSCFTHYRATDVPMNLNLNLLYSLTLIYPLGTRHRKI